MAAGARPNSMMTKEQDNRPCSLYRMYSDDHMLLYIGMSLNVAIRFKSHEESKSWWSEVAYIDLETYPTREEAADAEREAIRAENPLYNVQHADRPRLSVERPSTEETLDYLLGDDERTGDEVKDLFLALERAIELDRKLVQMTAVLIGEMTANGCGYREIERRTGIPRSTAHRLANPKPTAFYRDRVATT